MPGGHRAHQADAADGAVLGALHAAALDHQQAAGLQVEHGFLLRVAHEGLAARSGGAAHLHAAGRVGRGEEGLGIRGVVPVDKHFFGAVNRDGFRVGGQAEHAELQLGGLLHRALGEHAGAAALGSDQQPEGAQRRVPGDAHRGFGFGEAAQGGLRRVAGDLHRVIPQVGDMALVGGGAALPHLLHGHHHFHHVHVAEHLAQPGGGHAPGQPVDDRFVHVDIHQHPGHFQRVNGHGLLGGVQIDGVIREERVHEVEIRPGLAVHLHDPAVLHTQGGRRIIGGFHGRDARLRPFGDETVLIYGALCQRLEPFALRHKHHLILPVEDRINPPL